jgi:hypothetical protein
VSFGGCGHLYRSTSAALTTAQGLINGKLVTQKFNYFTSKSSITIIVAIHKSKVKNEIGNT